MAVQAGVQGDGAHAGWRAALAGAPGASMLAALDARPARELTGADLVDAIVAADRLLSAVTALQAVLFAEFARPGRAGDISALVEKLCNVGGGARHTDGSVDPVMLEGLVCDRAAQLAAAEVGAALTISPLAAGARIDHALELVDHLPATLAALRAGSIDRTRARLIADRTRVLPADLRSEVEHSALGLAAGRAPGRLRHLIDRAVISADPEAAQRRAEAARTERGVDRLPAEDSMSVIRALLPVEDAASVFTMIDLLAKASPGRDRTVGQRRADALSDLAHALLTDGYVDLSGFDLGTTGGSPTCGAGSPLDDGAAPAAAMASRPEAPSVVVGSEMSSEAGQDLAGWCQCAGAGSRSAEQARIDVAPTESRSSVTCPPTDPQHAGRRRPPRGPTRQGRQVHLTVTLAASTLAGLDRLPAQLSGCGAITAELAAMLACSASSLTAVVVDPRTGGAQAIGSTSYRPRQRVRDHAITAADTCRFPGCRHPAVDSDLDHRDPFDPRHPESGGPTAEANIDPLCRAHHLLKHSSTWSSVAAGDNGISWRSPTGHLYRDPAREFTLPGEWQRPERLADAAPLRAVTPNALRSEREQSRATASSLMDRMDETGAENPLVPLRMQEAEREFAWIRETARRRIRWLAHEGRGERLRPPQTSRRRLLDDRRFRSPVPPSDPAATNPPPTNPPPTNAAATNPAATNPADPPF